MSFRWWKNLDFSHKLSFARDRVVECYFWILGVYFEPEYILARRILTKVIAMTSVIDDITSMMFMVQLKNLRFLPLQLRDKLLLFRNQSIIPICYNNE